MSGRGGARGRGGGHGEGRGRGGYGDSRGRGGYGESRGASGYGGGRGRGGVGTREFSTSYQGGEGGARSGDSRGRRMSGTERGAGGRGARGRGGGVPAVLPVVSGNLRCLTNHFRLLVSEQGEQLTIWKHFVSFSRERDGGAQLVELPEDRKRELLSGVLDELVEAGQFTPEERSAILYDGDRLLASLLRIDLAHSTRGGWKVSIDSQHGISLANLQHAFKTHDDGTEEVAQAMQLIMTRAAEQAEYRMLLKSKFFKDDPRCFLEIYDRGGRGSTARQIWECFSQSVAAYRSDGLLSWDVVFNPQACVATKTVPLAAYLESVLEQLVGRPVQMSREEECRFILREGETMRRLSRVLTGLKVETRHILNRETGEPERRTHKIKEVTRLTATSEESEFILPDGRRVTVSQYFAEAYPHLPRIPPFQPLIRTGSRTRPCYIPISLCTMEKQPAIKGVPEKEREQVARHMIIPPIDRVGKVDQLLASLFEDANRPAARVLDTFGTRLDLRPRIADGIVLTPPKVCYTDGRGGSKTVQPVYGQWNLRGSAFWRGSSCTVWALYSFVEISEDVQRRFATTLREQARIYGIQLGLTPGVACYRRRDRRSPVEQFKSFLEFAKEKKCEILFVLLAEGDATDIYQRVKANGDRLFPTQCLRFDNKNVQAVVRGENPNMTYYANVMSKVNMKLQGVNQTVDADVFRRVIGVDKSTLVLGVEVSIFGVGGRVNRRVPAVCACTGNLDDDLGVYAHAISIQTQQQAGIAGLSESFQLIVGQRKLKQWPARLIYIRSGVSESRFASVLSGEIQEIEKLYLSRQLKKPAILAVVAQRRQQTRLYPTREMQDQGSNLPPGYLVYKHLEQPGTYLNFLLISHQALQGTVRPTRYFVLRNDMNLPREDVARLMYGLCHSYGRCQRSVSIPAPLYYAQLLAERARVYMKMHLEERHINVERLSDITDEAGTGDVYETIARDANKDVSKVGQDVRPMCYC